MRKLIKAGLLIRVLGAIIIAIPAMVFVARIDKLGVGSALIGASIVIWLFGLFKGD